jgi:hypothetical protein
MVERNAACQSDQPPKIGSGSRRQQTVFKAYSRSSAMMARQATARRAVYLSDRHPSEQGKFRFSGFVGTLALSRLTQRNDSLNLYANLISAERV